jgi:hypothetical protein
VSPYTTSHKDAEGYTTVCISAESYKDAVELMRAGIKARTGVVVAGDDGVYERCIYETACS